MITGNLIFAYSAQVMILVAAAAVAVKLARLRHARLRLLVYQAVLAACVLLPWLERWLPQEESSGLVTVSVSTWNAVLGSAPAGARLDIAGWMAWLLAAGAVVRLAWIGCGLLRLRHLRTHAVHIENAEGRPARIYVSRQIPGPATYGVLRPVILMPEHLSGNKAVLRHELIHIARFDWVWRLAEECALCLFWFHPAVWWLKSEIELAREQVVDGQTVSAVGSAGDYVQALVDVAARQIGQRPVLASEFLGKSSLRSRVEMLLAGTRESGRKVFCSGVAIAGCLAIAGWTSARALPLYWSDEAAADHASAQPDQQKAENSHQTASDDAPKQIRVGGATQEEKLVKKVTPVYPKAAKDAHIQGKVVLDVAISKEGRVTSVEPVSGPAELIQSAVDAVKQWEYRPTLLNGNPVEVKSDVLVNYTLSR
jgi:TonB family protein